MEYEYDLRDRWMNLPVVHCSLYKGVSCLLGAHVREPGRIAQLTVWSPGVVPKGWNMSCEQDIGECLSSLKDMLVDVICTPLSKFLQLLIYHLGWFESELMNNVVLGHNESGLEPVAIATIIPSIVTN